MKKFYNVCTIILWVLLLTTLATCIVMYWVNPGFLKRSIEYAKTILDKPLPIAGLTVGTLALLSWKIFSSTSVGKKGIAEMKEQCSRTFKQSEDLQSKAIEYCEQAKEYKNDTIAVLNDFYKQCDKLNEKLVKVCETSPNAKIKALGEEFKKQSESVKVEITEKIDNIGKVGSEKDKEIIDIKEKIAYLQEQLEKVVGEYENNE